MDQLITELKQQRLDQAGSEKVRQVEKASQDSNTLVSVLEEQFRAMETWLLPMTHGDKAERDRVIDQLRERFEIMVRGYNRLIEVLQSRRAEKEGHAGAESLRSQVRQVEKGPREDEASNAAVG